MDESQDGKNAVVVDSSGVCGRCDPLEHLVQNQQFNYSNNVVFSKTNWFY